MFQLWKRDTEPSLVVNRANDHAETNELGESEDGSVKLHGNRVEGERRDICQSK